MQLCKSCRTVTVKRGGTDRQDITPTAGHKSMVVTYRQLMENRCMDLMKAHQLQEMIYPVGAEAGASSGPGAGAGAEAACAAQCTKHYCMLAQISLVHVVSAIKHT